MFLSRSPIINTRELFRFRPHSAMNAIRREMAHHQVPEMWCSRSEPALCCGMVRLEEARLRALDKK